MEDSLDRFDDLNELAASFEKEKRERHIPRPPLKAVPEHISPWQLQKDQALEGTNGDPLLTHDALWMLLLLKAEEIINSSRRISEQKQAIKAVANDLGFRLSNAEIAEIFDQLDNSVSAYEPDVEPGQEFIAPGQSWFLDELILVGLNLLVGMPGAGKSRLLVAMVRAALTGQEQFIGRGINASDSSSVLIVGTDQDRQQWGALLEEQGLAYLVRREQVEGHENLTYRLHDRIHLKTSGGGFRLNPDGMRFIRNWNQQHPGGITIIDSLSAVLPPGISEADESAGRLMRQIEIARQGNTCIVTHHCNKQSAMSGSVGVYSGSGHGSIDRAVSRHIGLGYETHVEAGREKLHEESPRRVITSQKRGAINQRIIVENGNGNSWDYIGTDAEERELRRQANEGDAIDRLKGWQKATYAALTTEWLTTSAVLAALPSEKQSTASAPKQVQRALRALQQNGLIEEDRQSIGECRWRLPHT